MRVSELSQAAGDLLPGSCRELGALTASSYELVSPRESDLRSLPSLLGWSMFQKKFLNLLVNNSWRCQQRGWRSGHFKESPRKLKWIDFHALSLLHKVVVKLSESFQVCGQNIMCDACRGIPLGRSATQWRPFSRTWPLWRPFCRIYKGPEGQKSWSPQTRGESSGDGSTENLDGSS